MSQEEATKAPKKKLSLAAQIGIALVLAIIFGLLLQQYAAFTDS